MIKGFLEAESFRLTRLNVANRGSASGGRVVSPDGGIGIATASYQGAGGIKRTLKLDVFDRPGNGWIKVYSDGQRVAFFALNRNNDQRVRLKQEFQTRKGAELRIKLAGDEQLDAVRF